jgi:TPR repeat protein
MFGRDGTYLFPVGNRFVGNAALLYLIVAVTLLGGIWPRQVSAQDEAEMRAGVVKIVSTLEGKRRTGTGFAVKAEGTSVYIVTAAHVIEGDPAPKVEFFMRQNTSVGAVVLKQDLRYDLALLKAESPQQSLVLRLETTIAPKTGDEVTTIGFPQTGGAWLMSRADLAGRDGADLILSGGAIDEGNSGGPVIKGGKVIGVVQGLQGKFARAMPAGMVVGMLDGWGIAVAPETGTAISQDDKRVTDAEAGSIDYSNFDQVKKAADRADPRAMYELAGMYSDGKAVPENFSEAARWLRRSADAEYPEAHTGMGVLSLVKAVGFAGDDASAVRFASDESKRSELYSMILHPEKLQIQNQMALKDSVKWLRTAAERGHDANAQFVLGLLTGAGVGVPKDPVQAAKLIRLAATKEPAAQASYGYLLPHRPRRGEGFRRSGTAVARSGGEGGAFGLYSARCHVSRGPRCSARSCRGGQMVPEGRSTW